MLRKIQALPRGQRIVTFILLVGGALLALVAITALLIVVTLNTGERNQAIALVDGASVREYAALPDDNAYPAAVTAGPDGTVFTGSYATGAVWAIDSTGSVTELPDSRDMIGAVSGLTAGPDGSIYVVDQEDSSPVTLGGRVWRITPEGLIRDFVVSLDERGFVLPDDIALDAAGNVYVSDRGRGEVWRFGPDGSGGQMWWAAPAVDANAEDPTRYAPTGLAYDPVTATIIITDSNRNTVFRVGQDTEILYEHGRREFPPIFDGVTVAPDGTIYLAALEQNGIATIVDSELQYVAGSFRGASDVEYFDGRLFVTNFDSFSLVVAAVSPRLPFAIDVVDLPS